MFGLSAVVLVFAGGFTLIKCLGAAYLVHRGVRALLGRAPAPQPGAADQLTPRSAFHQALVAKMLKPKSAMFLLAFLPQFVHPEHGAVAFQLTMLGTLLMLVGLAVTIAVSVGSGRIGALLRSSPTAVRWQQKVVGRISCALGVRLAPQER